MLTVVSPIGENEGVNIHQNAWFSLSNLDKDVEIEYALRQKENGVYVFLLEGDATINDISINRRDGLGVSETDKLSIKAVSQAEILLMEISMN